jgi:hypothetical protein
VGGENTMRYVIDGGLIHVSEPVGNLGHIGNMMLVAIVVTTLAFALIVLWLGRRGDLTSSQTRSFVVGLLVFVTAVTTAYYVIFIDAVTTTSTIDTERHRVTVHRPLGPTLINFFQTGALNGWYSADQIAGFGMTTVRTVGGGRTGNRGRISYHQAPALLFVNGASVLLTDRASFSLAKIDPSADEAAFAVIRAAWLR